MKEDPSGPAVRFWPQTAASCCPSKAMVVSVAVNVETRISAGEVERGERKRTVDEVSKADKAMPKPGGDPPSGISSGEPRSLPERHPACRRREAQPGSCTERENLCSDAKGEIASGANREAESTNAPVRGGPL